MLSNEPRQRPGGRSARVRGAVLEATLDYLTSEGLPGLKIKDVAERAGVNETSIYRRWGTREGLICDALLSQSARAIPVPDTGAVREDLIELATSLATYLSTPLGAALMQTLAVADDRSGLAQVRESFWRARYELASVIVERAVARRELPQNASARFVLEALIAPLHFRVVLSRQPIDDLLPRHLADFVLRGIRGGGNGNDST